MLFSSVLGLYSDAHFPTKSLLCCTAGQSESGALYTHCTLFSTLKDFFASEVDFTRPDFPTLSDILRFCTLGRLIIERAHKAAIHGGQALTYSYAIRTTWIIGGRVQVRQCVCPKLCNLRSLARDTFQPKGGRSSPCSDQPESTLCTHRPGLRWTFLTQGLQPTRSR